MSSYSNIRQKLNEKEVNLSNFNNCELIEFISYVKKNNLWGQFCNVYQYSLTQERINQIDSYTWRKLISILPYLAKWCNIDKLNTADISNIFLGENGNYLLLSKYSKNSVEFMTSYNKKYFKLFKIKLTETKKQFKVELINHFDFFNYESVIKLIIFEDSTLNDLGLSFDLESYEDDKLGFYLNKDSYTKPKDQILIALNNIIKNNLFNLSKLF